ncbi:MAG: LysR family transcriptional regulator [Jaaginema sp. PMC 1079.18]|nr:LysR family transcriptional regulator [Jaaginema sp. PMC 1080.18]MEC4853027.1 LysR family transcriptional regulator [Jaaginema sp. PMC 1079.18]MEC4868107.1 LysR family transcriptional regulator [Jaaginema sp. PMC 1078.18]
MRIEQLEAFLAIAQTGSFGQAARDCGVTQSTISRQIQALEALVGTALFHRTTQAKLTVGGEQLLPRARRICGEWHNALREITELKEGKQPELCVAAIHSVCAHKLPPVLQQFCRIYPNVKLRVTALGSDRALKVLRDGLVDVAIVMNNRFLTTSPEMSVNILYDEPIEVLMAAHHPLAQYQQVPWTELVRYPQVVFKDGYGMQRLVQERFSLLNAQLKTAMELNTLDGFRGVVRQGEIIALLPQSALINVESDLSLAKRPLAPCRDSLEGNSLAKVQSLATPLTRQVVLATTKDRLEIPLIQRFCDLVAKSCSNPTAPVLASP